MKKPTTLGQLKPNTRNPRTISDAKLDVLKASLIEHGDLSGFVMNVTTGNLVGGHQRQKALPSDAKIVIEKEHKKPTRTGTIRQGHVLVDGEQFAYREVKWPVKKETSAMLAANQIGGDWDTDLLTDILRGLDESDRLLAGFDLPDLKELGIELNGDGAVVDAEPQIDKAKQLQKKWKTRTGQLWACGEHRLLVGDSTKAEDVARVMGGERAALCLTDAPYGVGEQYHDQQDTPETLKTLIDAFFPLAQSVSDRILLTPGNSNQRLYPQPDWTLCWFVAAGTGMNKWGFTCWQPILAYGQDPFLKNGDGSRPDAFALTESAENKLGHPCPKPLGVWSWVLNRGSFETGDIVFDPFSGSGTTLMACENLHRKCRAIEIDAGYTAVALERWSVATSKTPTLL